MSDAALNVGEILLLEYVDGHELPQNVPNYFEYYGVDFKQSIKKMFDNGYLEYAPLEYALSKRSVAELKSVLENESLSAKGKKDILVSRILENIPHDRFVGFSQAYCMATDKGKQLISENEHIFFFHRINNRIGINIYDADAYKKEHPTLSNVEIALNMLDERKVKRASEGKYSLVRNVYCEKAFIYENDEHQIEAIKCYYVVCYFDKLFHDNVEFCQVNGSTIDYLNRNCCDSLLKLKDDFIKKHRGEEMLYAPGIINGIKDIIIKNNLSQSQLENIQLEARNELFNICEPIKTYILPLISTEFLDVDSAKTM